MYELYDRDKNLMIERSSKFGLFSTERLVWSPTFRAFFIMCRYIFAVLQILEIEIV